MPPNTGLGEQATTCCTRRWGHVRIIGEFNKTRIEPPSRNAMKSILDSLNDGPIGCDMADATLDLSMQPLPMD